MTVRTTSREHCPVGGMQLVGVLKPTCPPPLFPTGLYQPLSFLSFSSSSVLSSALRSSPFAQVNKMGPSNRNVIFPLAFVICSLFVVGTYKYTSTSTSTPRSQVSTNELTKSNKPRYIFVDLGANRADSLEVFLQHPGAKYTYDYPRPTWATHDEAGKTNTVLRVPLLAPPPSRSLS